MSSVATAVVGGSIVSGYLAGEGAEDAANISADAERYAADKNMEMFNKSNELLAPWRELGESFIDPMRKFMRGDYKGFLESPDYKFAMQEGEKALQRKQSAAGSRYGGAALKEAVQFGQGMASQYTDNYFNRLFNVMNIGANAAVGSAQNALSTGQTLGNIAMAGGANRANIAMQNSTNQANIVNGAVGNLTTLAMYNRMFPAGAGGAA